MLNILDTDTGTKKRVSKLNTTTVLVNEDGSRETSKRFFVMGIPTLAEVALELEQLKKDNKDYKASYTSITSNEYGDKPDTFTLDIDLKLEEKANA